MSQRREGSRGVCRSGFAAAHIARRGGALVLALIVAVTVAGAAAAMLYFTMHFARRQQNAVHDQRAFYLAEAGLSEAYQAIVTGQSGQIGNRGAPAASGDGLLWVDADPQMDGTVRLDSTALVGFGRSSLSMVVQRSENPLGIFSREDLVVDAPILVDGYDSTAGAYEDQLQDPGLVRVPQHLTTPALAEDIDRELPSPDAQVVVYEGVEFLVLEAVGADYVLQLFDEDDGDIMAAFVGLDALYGGNAPLSELPVAWSDYNLKFLEEMHATGWVDLTAEIEAATPPRRQPDDSKSSTETSLADGGSLDWATSTDTSWSTASAESEPGGDVARATATDGTSTTTTIAPLGPSTGGGGKLASNGAVSFSASQSEVWGDVVAGPGSEVSLGVGNYVSGDTRTRSQAIELEEVTLPAVTLEPALTWGGATPMVIPPSTVGYQGLTVLGDAELIVQGPSTVVVGDLALADRALLQVDNLDGSVDLFVFGSAELALGSRLSVASTDPTQLSLRLGSQASPVTLAATSEFHGLVYGPSAAIAVESPFEIFGGLVGRALDLGAGVRLHFDSGLAGGRLPIPLLVSWDVAELPSDLKARRISAHEFHGSNHAELAPPSRSMETYSWTARISYISWWGSEYVYEGPFELWDPESANGWPVLEELVAPTAEGAGAWTAEIHYSYDWTDHVYAGPVGDVPREALYFVKRMTITPPPTLLDQGREPTTWRRNG